RSGPDAGARAGPSGAATRAPCRRSPASGAGVALDGAEHDPDDDRADDRQRERTDEPLRRAVAQRPRQPAADDRPENAHDDGREAALHAARAHEPARDRAGQEADDDPAEEVEPSHRPRWCRAARRPARSARSSADQPRWFPGDTNSTRLQSGDRVGRSMPVELVTCKARNDVVGSESGQMRGPAASRSGSMSQRSSSWYPYGTIASNRAGPPRVREARSALASGGRDVLVQPEEVLGVVAALDVCQPVVGRTRVGGPDDGLAG